MDSWKSLLSQTGSGDHLVEFYEDDRVLTQKVGHFLCEGLDRGEAVIVIATAAHQESFAGMLTRREMDVDRMIRQGQIRLLDAGCVLSRILKHGEPDRDSFGEVIGSIVETSRSQSLFHGLRAYGEMADLLWKDRRRAAALRLENLWNEFLEDRGMPLLCGYRLDLLGEEFPAREIHGILAAHSHLVPSAEPTDLRKALMRSLEEILGEDRALALLPLMLASESPGARLRPEEGALMWIGRNLETYRDDILERTRFHLGGHPGIED